MSQVQGESPPIVPEVVELAVPVAELSVPVMVYPYTVGLSGGALGGLAMVGVALLYGVISGYGVWLPVNLIGATIVRDLQGASIETLSQFNAAAFVAGLLLHAALSIGLGMIFALLLPTMPGPPIIWSLTLPLLNPVMEQHVEKLSFFIAHLVYGIVLGWYVARQPKIHVQ